MLTFLQHPVERVPYTLTHQAAVVGLSVEHTVSFPSGLGMRLECIALRESPSCTFQVGGITDQLKLLKLRPPMNLIG